MSWENTIKEKIVRCKKVKLFVDEVNRDYPAFITALDARKKEARERINKVQVLAEENNVIITIHDENTIARHLVKAYGITGVEGAIGYVYRGQRWRAERVIQANLPEIPYLARAVVKNRVVEIQFPLYGTAINHSALPEPIKVMKNGKRVYEKEELLLTLLELEKELYEMDMQSLRVERDK